MNMLWGGMQLIGILYGAFNGRMQEITDAVLSASREAVTLCVTMTGILAFWQGLMEIAKDAGLTDVLCGKIRPLIRAFLAILPDVAVLMLYLAVKLRIVTLAAK